IGEGLAGGRMGLIGRGFCFADPATRAAGAWRGGVRGRSGRILCLRIHDAVLDSEISELRISELKSQISELRFSNLRFQISESHPIHQLRFHRMPSSMPTPAAMSNDWIGFS